MNRWTLLLILIGLGAVGMLNKDKIAAYIGSKPSADEAAAETPAPATPNPAGDSIAKARAAFPNLAVSNSTFNKKFIELYNAKKASDPAFLTAADWPMKLAQQTADALGNAPTTFQPPTAASTSTLNDRPPSYTGSTVPPAVQLPGLKGSALDQRPASGRRH